MSDAWITISDEEREEFYKKKHSEEILNDLHKRIYSEGDALTGLNPIEEDKEGTTSDPDCDHKYILILQSTMCEHCGKEEV